MNPLDRHAFLQLDERAQIQSIVDLCRSAEQHWEDPSERGRLLKQLRHQLGWCRETGLPSFRFLWRLAPLLQRPLSASEFYALVAPAERHLERHFPSASGPRVEEGDRHRGTAPSFPLVVILDNLRSAFNVGSVFRTCETVGVEKIYLCGYTATPENPKVRRAAMGTENRVAWEWEGRTEQVLQRLSSEGWSLLGLETAVEAQSVFAAPVDFPAALVLGNERFGLSADVLKRCDRILRIPVYGTKNSLNVANAFGVCAYELRRRWNPI